MHSITLPNIYNYLSALDNRLDIPSTYLDVREHCIECGFVTRVLPVNSGKFNIADTGLTLLENIGD